MSEFNSSIASAGLGGGGGAQFIVSQSAADTISSPSSGL
jgi:hypothetical protein